MKPPPRESRFWREQWFRRHLMRLSSWSRVPEGLGGLTQSPHQPSTEQPKPVSRMGAGEEPTSLHPSAPGSAPLCCVLRGGWSHCLPGKPAPVGSRRDLPGIGRGLPLKIMEIHIDALLILKRQVSFDPWRYSLKPEGQVGWGGEVFKKEDDPFHRAKRPG